ncbi:hypothetical protein ACF0H5_010370 [Mactra antiquata]
MNWIMNILIITFILLGLIKETFSQTGADAKALKEKIFVTDGYDYKIRPQQNQSAPIDVYINFYLLAINELSEVTETLKTTGYLWILWQDDFLQWNASDYGNLWQYFWPQGDVWRPDIALKNSFTDYKALGVDTLNVMVESTGHVQWYPFQVFQSTCAVDITYYPYDIQTCKLEFVAWSYSKAEVNLMSGAKGIDLWEYESNSEWEVLDTNYTTEAMTYEAQIVFTIKIQRKPTYVLLSVIMPIIMLAILNIAVFLLPCESGEKASYAVTVFLAFAVFLSIISSTLPENSDTIAVFSMYLIILTLESTLITLTALVLIRVSTFDQDGTPVPRLLMTGLNFLTCKSCCCKKKNKVKDKKDEDDIWSINKTTIEEIPCDDETKPEGTWRDVVNAFDKIFFIFYILVLAVSTVVFFVVVSTNKG